MGLIQYPMDVIRRVAADPAKWSALDGRRDMLIDVLEQLDQAMAERNRLLEALIAAGVPEHLARRIMSGREDFIAGNSD